jgi:hypothetical protein
VDSLLLDTHALCWYEAGAPQLSSRALGVMRTGASPLTVSATSIWEGHRRRGVAVVSQRRDASCSLIAAVRRRVRGPHRQRSTSGGLLPLKLVHRRIQKIPTMGAFVALSWRASAEQAG